MGMVGRGLRYIPVCISFILWLVGRPSLVCPSFQCWSNESIPLFMCHFFDTHYFRFVCLLTMVLFRSLGVSVVAVAPSNGANCYWDWCSSVLQTLVVPCPCFASLRLHLLAILRPSSLSTNRSFLCSWSSALSLILKSCHTPGLLVIRIVVICKL